MIKKQSKYKNIKVARILPNGESVTFEPFKEFMLDILEDNGLVNHYLKEKQ